jgi:hypothetical protein
MNTKELLETRTEEYGDTWLIAGRIIAFLNVYDLLGNIVSTPYSHNWFMILSKMIRLLYSPNKLDTWQDIEGYAKLVADRVRRERLNKQDIKE